MWGFLYSTLALTVCVATASAQVPTSLAEIFTSRVQRDTNFERIYANISTITQRLDNFDLQNNATFEQLYLADGQYFEAGGPIYLVLEGFQAVDGSDFDGKLISMVARSEHGHLFRLEPRYFGNSIPTNNLSVENLRFLTVDQTLADIAHFVNHIKTVTPGAQDSPVIVIGRHFGGSLAVWFRQKYPHLSAGVWASSSPLEALQNQQQFKVNAAATIRDLSGDACYGVIDAGFAELEGLALAGNLVELGELLNVCDTHPLDSDNDVGSLFLIISQVFTEISSIRPYVPVLCDLLLQNNDTITAGEALAYTLRNMTDGYCMHVDYEEFIRIENDIEPVEDGPFAGLRQQSYQFCTQLGWWATSESRNQPFGSFYPLSFFTEICTRVFGEEVAGHAIVQANQDRFNVEHGGINPSITNALYTYGDMDPSRSLGVLHDLHESAVVIAIPDAGLSYDYYEIYGDDDPWVAEKMHVMEVIRSWSLRKV